MTDRTLNEANGHDWMQSVLPWSLTGALDTSEQALADAHLATCQDCHGDLARERRMRAELEHLQDPIEADWGRLRRRMSDQDTAPTSPPRPSRPKRIERSQPWLAGLGWGLAGLQAAVLAMVFAGPLTRPAPLPSAYHVLSAAGAASHGNMIVMFRPDSRARDIERLLTDSHTRIVDGPTAAGAYVLEAPPAERAVVLTGLRRRTEIVMAQPLDPPSSTP